MLSIVGFGLDVFQKLSGLGFGFTSDKPKRHFLELAIHRIRNQLLIARFTSGRQRWWQTACAGRLHMDPIGPFAASEIILRRKGGGGGGPGHSSRGQQGVKPFGAKRTIT